MHEWHPSNVSYLLKRGIITERPDGRLDLRQVEAQLTEHTGRPTLFRSVSDAEFMEARIRKMQWQTLIRETQIRRQLNLLVSRRDHRVKLSYLGITFNKKSSPPAGILPSSTAPLTDVFRSSTSPSAAPSKKPSSRPTSPVSNLKVPQTRPRISTPKTGSSTKFEVSS